MFSVKKICAKLFCEFLHITLFTNPKKISAADYGQTFGDINNSHKTDPPPQSRGRFNFYFLGEKNLGEIFFSISSYHTFYQHHLTNFFEKITVYSKDISRINFFWCSYRGILGLCFCKTKFNLKKQRINFENVFLFFENYKNDFLWNSLVFFSEMFRINFFGGMIEGE